MNLSQVAVIASTMRSGSTLLKALLGEGPDVSHLPEVNFQRFAGGHWTSQELLGRLEQLSPQPILVLKRPAWYHETGTYPRLPNAPGLKLIVLVRDAYETILSLRSMTFRRAAPWLGPWGNSWFVNRYWAPVTNRLLQCSQRPEVDCRLVRYEDLVSEPVRVTGELFRWLGSQRQEGVDEYQEPETAHWRWGRDDGGRRIKSLRVQPPRAHRYEDRRLLRAILRSDQAREVRRSLGYPPLPEA